MLERRLQELKLLEEKYGPTEHDENVTYIIFEQFPLPSGWDRKTVRLMMLIPAGYPTTPPDNFYVDPSLKLASGASIGNYSQPVTQLNQSWGQFSFHIDGDWAPKSDYLKGHNLLTFMIKVQGRLNELN